MNFKDIKLLLVGDYPTPVYTGVLGSYKRAFDKLNINTLEFYFNINFNYLRFAKYFKVALKILVYREQKRFLNFIAQNHITHIFVIKGSYLLLETIEEIKTKGIKISVFNPDNPFNKVHASSNFIIKESIPYYDSYFIWSKEICKKINQLYNKENGVYLPFAVDKELINFQPDFNLMDYSYELSFIANADKERINQIKKLISNDESIKKMLVIFGSGWEVLKNIKKHGIINNQNYFNTIFRSKINLNFLRAQNKGGHNMRTFEIPACGGFMLHEYSEEAMVLFKADEQAVYFSSIDECIDKIKFYLKHDDIRKKIAKSGYMQAIKFENSYEARAQLILKFLI
jgi:spore maturation protein CgeB